MRGETITVDVNHALQYQVGQQIWWDTNYAVDSIRTERLFRAKVCWDELVLPPNIATTNQLIFPQP